MRGPAARPCLQVTARTTLCQRPRAAELSAILLPAGPGLDELPMPEMGCCPWDPGVLTLCSAGRAGSLATWCMRVPVFAHFAAPALEETWPEAALLELDRTFPECAEGSSEAEISSHICESFFMSPESSPECEQPVRRIYRSLGLAVDSLLELALDSTKQVRHGCVCRTPKSGPRP